MEAQELKFQASNSSGEVSALLLRPEDAVALYVFGHGAGAGMRHRAMEEISQSLAKVGIATFRYNFPYMENKSGAPNPKPVLLATVRSAIEAARQAAPGVPIYAGGKSMGGRMTSQAITETPIPDVKGLIFYGFPLHPTGKPGIERAEHLAKVQIPMLFLQGTKDTLADLELLRPVCRELGNRATLHIVDTADHSFHVLKSSGKTDAQVTGELSEIVRGWIAEKS